MQTQQKPTSQAALTELVHQAQYQSEQLRLLTQDSRHIHVKMVHHAIIAACVAALIAAAWVYTYLVYTVYGFNGCCTPLLDYVTGKAVNIAADQSTQALFVVLARFMLAFGASWAPLTLLTALLDFARQLIFKSILNG